MKKGEILEGIVTRVDYPGKGVVETPEGICIVKNVLPGQRVSLRVSKKRRGKAEGTLQEVLEKALPFLQGLQDYTNDGLFEALKGFAADHGWKNGQIMWPIRTAVSGKETTPGGATQLLEILGKEESLERIRAAIGKLEHELG